MKKLFGLLLIGVLLLSLCACGKQKIEKEESDTSTTNQPAVIQSHIGDETLQYPAKNDEFEYKVYETYIEITKYIGSETAVTIPSTIGKLPVKSISDWSLGECKTVTSITLPDGIVEIGYSAFADCIALKEINIPDSVEEIGERAFHGCVSLVELTIPKSVTKIGEQAVGSSGSIGTYKKTDVVVKVYKGSYALQWVLDNYIPHYEVLGMGEEDGNTTDQSTVTESHVGGETLQYPAKNDEFEYKVYETYIEITKYVGSETIVTVPSTIEKLPVKSISDWSLGECKTVTSITLPDGIVEIGYSAFADCIALKEINIPDSVEEIGERAFHGCVSLVELTIPKSVTKIGEQAVGWSGSIGTYKQTDVIVKVYKASYAVEWVLDNYIQYYEVLG